MRSNHLIGRIKKLDLLMMNILMGVTAFTFPAFAETETIEAIAQPGMGNVNIQVNLKSGYENQNQNSSEIEITADGSNNSRKSDFSLFNSADMRFFIPFYDEEAVIFAQGGFVHDRDLAQTTFNIGIGSRFFVDENFAIGGNTFFDYYASEGSYHRFGIGAEALFDYGKLYGNFYRRIGAWKETKHKITDKNHQTIIDATYLARAATGFDVGAQVYLPSYPQLGMKVNYEKYFGEQVGLKGNNSVNNWEKDPSRLILGVNYTLVPAITLGGEYRQHWNNNSTASDHETISMDKDGFYATLALTYRFGVDPNTQFSFDGVDAIRHLGISRYDFVERNNQIVLEFMKQQKERVDIMPSDSAHQAAQAAFFAFQEKYKAPQKEEAEFEQMLKDNKQDITNILRTGNPTGDTLAGFQQIIDDLDRASFEQKAALSNEITRISKAAMGEKYAQYGEVSAEDMHTKIKFSQAHLELLIKVNEKQQRVRDLNQQFSSWYEDNQDSLEGISAQYAAIHAAKKSAQDFSKLKLADTSSLNRIFAQEQVAKSAERVVLEKLQVTGAHLSPEVTLNIKSLLADAKAKILIDSATSKDKKEDEQIKSHLIVILDEKNQEIVDLIINQQGKEVAEAQLKAQLQDKGYIGADLDSKVEEIKANIALKPDNSSSFSDAASISPPSKSKQPAQPLAIIDEVIASITNSEESQTSLKASIDERIEKGIESDVTPQELEEQLGIFLRTLLSNGKISEADFSLLRSEMQDKIINGQRLAKALGNSTLQKEGTAWLNADLNVEEITNNLKMDEGYRHLTPAQQSLVADVIANNYKEAEKLALSKQSTPAVVEAITTLFRIKEADKAEFLPSITEYIAGKQRKIRALEKQYFEAYQTQPKETGILDFSNFVATNIDHEQGLSEAEKEHLSGYGSDINETLHSYALSIVDPRIDVNRLLADERVLDDAIAALTMNTASSVTKPLLKSYIVLMQKDEIEDIVGDIYKNKPSIAYDSNAEIKTYVQSIRPDAAPLIVDKIIEKIAILKSSIEQLVTQPQRGEMSQNVAQMIPLKLDDDIAINIAEEVIRQKKIVKRYADAIISERNANDEPATLLNFADYNERIKHFNPGQVKLFETLLENENKKQAQKYYQSLLIIKRDNGEPMHFYGEQDIQQGLSKLRIDDSWLVPVFNLFKHETETLTRLKFDTWKPEEINEAKSKNIALTNMAFSQHIRGPRLQQVIDYFAEHDSSAEGFTSEAVLEKAKEVGVILNKSDNTLYETIKAKLFKAKKRAQTTPKIVTDSATLPPLAPAYQDSDTQQPPVMAQKSDSDTQQPPVMAQKSDSDTQQPPVIAQSDGVTQQPPVMAQKSDSDTQPQPDNRDEFKRELGASSSLSSGSLDAFLYPAEEDDTTNNQA